MEVGKVCRESKVFVVEEKEIMNKVEIVEQGKRYSYGVWKSTKPFFAVFILQLGLAGLAIIAKVAMNQGLSPSILVVYRHAVATIVIAPFALIFERNKRPKMTLSVFVKIMVLGLLEPVIDQNLYYTGMNYTTATFTSAMTNVLPALTFVMAWILGMEKVNIRKMRTQAKIIGTVVSVGGAMIMTLIKGPLIHMFWTEGRNSQDSSIKAGGHQDMIKGSIMILCGCFCWASFVILQAITLRTYPAEITLTALICLMGTVEGSVVALVVERGNAAVWSINWDMKLLAAVYGGIVCSAIGFYLQGMIMKERGPVFVTAFSPLTMIIVAVLGLFILAEQMYLGRVIGAVIIVSGLYLVVWGKSKDHLSSSKTENDQITSVTLPKYAIHAQKSIPQNELVSIRVAAVLTLPVTLRSELVIKNNAET